MKVLLDENELSCGVQQLAERLNKAYEGRPLTVIGIMTGSLVILADVIRKLDMPLRVGVVQTSSYAGTERRELTINSEMMLDIVSQFLKTDREIGCHHLRQAKDRPKSGCDDRQATRIHGLDFGRIGLLQVGRLENA